MSLFRQSTTLVPTTKNKETKHYTLHIHIQKVNMYMACRNHMVCILERTALVRTNRRAIAMMYHVCLSVCPGWARIVIIRCTVARI